MADLIKRKNAPRLHHFDYSGSNIYFVTCATYHRKPLFTSDQRVRILIPIIHDTCLKSEFSLFVYCFMPDHLHLLLGGDEHSNLKHHMQSFKQVSAFKFREQFNSILWQRSYYEHVLRRDEAVEEVARYILNNPVRAGLVQDFRQYPYSGSSLFNINEL